MGLFGGRSKESDEATGEALERTRRGIFGRVAGMLGGSDVTEELWETLEEVLIGADAGVDTTFEVLGRVRARNPRRSDDLRRYLAEELVAILDAADEPRGRLWGLPDDASMPDRPWVVLVVGVNGSGKTTAIGRLAYAYQQDGRRVLAAAGDTFRAAAIEQLQSWGERLKFDVVAQGQGADPSAVAFDAISAAQARGHDVVLIDTAGRLQNKQNLMAELSKTRRVIERHVERGPDEVLLVLDASTGQNGLSQARHFTEAVQVTSVMLTKLDGTARGGIVFAIAREFGLPVRFVGVGQREGDLAPFDPYAFVAALLGEPASAGA
ncbi:MAG: signal recognition particle-docking protein FtsY [Chloroflexi bacterium]|nr:signal recognition particle-docking protein FtsY [Chloroflexota bacterium]MDA1239939.1 signal recognition particle-docking protein FtsY [Chloroflexota bacterium]MQC25649.1 signal recognition particle-docking protein FtsY [Chloroflexota bacterium]MQC48077.1 signal recognition particle-docking protein FtsY [Chloroflexota bacterium]